MEGVLNSLTKYYGLDWAGVLFSMLSMHYLAKKRKLGFLIGMFGNLAFVSFGILAESAANVLANGAYFALNVRCWLKWKADPPRSASQLENCDCPPEPPAKRSAGKSPRSYPPSSNSPNPP